MTELVARAVARGGRLTKWKGRVASIASSMILGSVSVLALPPVLAQADTISTAQTTALASSVDTDHTITSTGAITLDPATTFAAIEIDVSDYASTLTNSGSLKVADGSIPGHIGILLMGDLSGQIINAGTIDIDVSGSSSAFGVGIGTGDVSGYLESSGTISVDAFGSSSAAAFGIFVDEVSGDMLVSGNIDVNVTGLSTASASGIQISEVTGTVTNSGTITVATQAIFSGVSDNYGISVDGTLAGSLTNSGAISVSGSASSYADATGIYSGLLTGTFENSGSITADVNAFTGNAQGIDINGISASGLGSNSGTITVTGFGGSSMYVDAINLRDVGGTFTNTGTLSATVSASSAGAVGLDASNVSGALHNEGDISVIAQHGFTANAIAIDMSTLSGTFTNSGSLSALASATGTGTAIGIDTSTVSGTLNNSGSISVLVQDASSAYARGIDTSSIDGSLINSGSISVAMENIGYSGYAYGINTSGVSTGGSFLNTGDISIAGSADSYAETVGLNVRDIGGSYENRGTLSISGTVSGSSAARVYGIETSDLETSGSFVNSGDIVLNASGPSAYAYGIDTDSVDGSFSNSGDITLNATGTSTGFYNGYATAEGLSFYRVGTTGTVSNSGNITLNVDAKSAYAYAIDVYQISGKFENSGDIVATVKSEESGSFVGVSVYSVETGGEFKNSGNINASFDAELEEELESYGFYVNYVRGLFDNSGDINLTAQTAVTSSAEQYGLYAYRTEAGGTLNNSGAITVTGISPDAETNEATGLRLFYADGDVVNSGDLTIRAEGGLEALATGIDVYESTGTIEHSGQMTVSANSATGSAHATGIHIINHNGILNVTGNITATSDDTAFAIELQNGSGTLNLASSATIEGRIKVVDHDVNLSHTGQTAVYEFLDLNTGVGTYTTTTQQDNGAWVTSGEGGANPTYAAVNMEDFEASVDTPFAVSALSSGVLTELSTVSPGVDLSDVSTNGFSARPTSLSPFLRFDVSKTDRQGSSSGVLATSATAGFVGSMDNGHRYGLGLSTFRLDGESQASDLEANGLFVTGLYQLEVGRTELTFGLGYGRLGHEDSRAIVGSANAEAEYDSSIAVGSISAERSFNQDGAGTWSALGGLTFGQQKSDGYTETGSTANATMPDRSVNFSEISLGVKYAHKFETGLGWVALNGKHRRVSGMSGFDVSVLDSTISTGASSNGTDSFGELAFGYEMPVSGLGKLVLQASTTVGGDTNTRKLSGLFQIKF